MTLSVLYCYLLLNLELIIFDESGQPLSPRDLAVQPPSVVRVKGVYHHAGFCVGARILTQILMAVPL